MDFDERLERAIEAGRANDEAQRLYQEWNENRRRQRRERRQEIDALRPDAVAVIRRALEGELFFYKSTVAAAVFVLNETQHPYFDDYDGPTVVWPDDPEPEDEPMKVVIVGDERATGGE